MLWALNNVPVKEAIFPVAARLMGRVVRRKSFEEITDNRVEELDENYVDSKVLTAWDLWIHEIDFKTVSEGKTTIEELLEMDRRDRHRQVNKLKLVVNNSFKKRFKYDRK
jgi:hypothetical protein